MRTTSRQRLTIRPDLINVHRRMRAKRAVEWEAEHDEYVESLFESRSCIARLTHVHIRISKARYRMGGRT